MAKLATIETEIYVIYCALAFIDTALLKHDINETVLFASFVARSQFNSLVEWVEITLIIILQQLQNVLEMVSSISVLINNSDLYGFAVKIATENVQS